MSAGYTPGPWVASVPWEGQDTGVYAADGQVYVARVFHMRNANRSEANARLVAAAPDLLEACERLVERVSAEAIEQARAAIAKAKGGAA